MMIGKGLAAATFAVAIHFGSAAAQVEPCTEHSAHSALDFWVGDWTVWVGEQQVGTNRIVKVQGSCAIEEHWTDARGGTGQSLFYYIPWAEEWRQVWVTPTALATGGVKEKRQIDGPAGAVRFQGTVVSADGTEYLDRTTLTPLDGGRVRQHIEFSPDGGTTWRTTFDAVYRPAEGSRSTHAPTATASRGQSGS
jgi:hypothetical protein